jgi:RNA polymerase sigma factor (sigma-70 family)
VGVVVLTSQSDERLVRLARAGHERAFTVIVERYGSELLALARRLSPDGKAEDIVQQAFLSAFAALQSGAEVVHLRGWLYRIVRNVAARSRAPMCIPLDGGAVSGESVEDVAEQRALAISTLQELARLPTRQREAMVGTALDGRGRAEVASSMGVSEGAVRQLVHRARARLRTVVTAVTPWPLVRWLAGGPAGSESTISAVAGAGAGAVSSGGFFGVKFGVVLAWGAIATGVAAVGVHAGGRWAHAGAASATAAAPHPHRARGHVQALEAAAASPAVAAPVVLTRAPTGGHVAASGPSPAAPTTGAARTAAAARLPATRGGHTRTTDQSGRSDGGSTPTAGHGRDGGGDGSGGKRDGGGGASGGGDRVGGGERAGSADVGFAGGSAGSDGGGSAGSSGGGGGSFGGQLNGGAQAAWVTADTTGFEHRAPGFGQQGTGFDQQASGFGPHDSRLDQPGSGLGGHGSGD